MTISKVDVVNIFLDQKNGVPVVLLQDTESKDTLPILIAPLEASMIAIELEGKKPIRPLTHDLIINILNKLSYTIDSVVINDLKDNIYYANIVLISEGDSVEIDCRPSDAIALALRTKSPIYVERKVFALSMGIQKAVKNVDKETLKEVLKDLKIEDVGGKIM
ncbi:MAG: bifunctional nuclease family protein [Spirochaetota bacterium]|nr:bifunctional nuclease family protein [Spirochaetota bacterium]